MSNGVFIKFSKVNFAFVFSNLNALYSAYDKKKKKKTMPLKYCFLLHRQKCTVLPSSIDTKNTFSEEVRF